jgi:uncharacterized Zn finger protein (UPF0148 family)
MYEGKEFCPNCDMMMREEGGEKYCPHCSMTKETRISMNMGRLPDGYIRQSSSKRSNPSEARRNDVMRRMS